MLNLGLALGGAPGVDVPVLLVLPMLLTAGMFPAFEVYRYVFHRRSGRYLARFGPPPATA